MLAVPLEHVFHAQPFLGERKRRGGNFEQRVYGAFSVRPEAQGDFLALKGDGSKGLLRFDDGADPSRLKGAERLARGTIGIKIPHVLF